MVKSLPPTSPLRKPILKSVRTKFITRQQMAQKFGVSLETIKRAENLPNEENLLLKIVSNPLSKNMKDKNRQVFIYPNFTSLQNQPRYSNIILENGRNNMSECISFDQNEESEENENENENGSESEIESENGHEVEHGHENYQQHSVPPYHPFSQ